MYYAQGRTMEAIAGALGTSRSTVSRMLREARATGIVEITLRSPGTPRREEIGERIADRYGVRVEVAPRGPGESETQRLRSVADRAARRIDEILQPDMTIGIAWGTTTSAIVDHLRPRGLSGLQMVQLNGSINTEGAGLEYVSMVLDRASSVWGARVHHFPVPAFFDFPETKAALWRERSVQHVLRMQERCRLAVFSVGAFDAEVPSHVHASGYLAAEDLAALRADGAVADVCTVFLRADGTWDGVRMNARCSGPDPARLARIPRRLLVAAGQRKAVPLRAALLAGTATDVVVDETTGAALLALDDAA
ncbi:MAG: sugar-binding domain-containing protein [Brachybacterium sp.]|nr:sugar-binding domain-containing protein [Brachybacterium sp.]